MEIREWQRLEILKERSSSKISDRAQAATRDAFTWLTRYTKTYNQHWQEEGRPSPYEPFPPHNYLAAVLYFIDQERITWWEKSRDMMLSWACVGYLTMNAMAVPEREVLFQTQKQDKAIQLVKYASCLYHQQPDWLKREFPLESESQLEMHFERGGSVVGIPGGADQIRSYHPWGYLNDESSFQPDAGECYNEALAAVKGKIIFNSSAGPGWYADARRDIIRATED
jgi:hypothetical protein